VFLKTKKYLEASLRSEFRNHVKKKLIGREEELQKTWGWGATNRGIGGATRITPAHGNKGKKTKKKVQGGLCGGADISRGNIENRGVGESLIMILGKKTILNLGENQTQGGDQVVRQKV